MTFLANILLALVAIGSYGGYAVYSRAHGDSADLVTLIRQDLGTLPAPEAPAHGDLLAYDIPDIPDGMSPQDYAQYLAELNAEAAAYRASHPDPIPAVPTSTAPVASAPKRQTAPLAVAPKPVRRAQVSVSVQSHTETPTTYVDTGPSVASVSDVQAVQVVPPPVPIQPDPAPAPAPVSQTPVSQIIDQPSPTPTPAPTPTPVPAPAPEPAVPAGRYRDGTYTGTSADAIYGYVQVQAVVSGGALASVKFLSYPSDRRQSQQINSYAMPILIQQAITAQSAQVSGVSGATDTSIAFRKSLAAALSQA
jgi:uncharacterized protein with FMN-binding domain